MSIDGPGRGLLGEETTGPLRSLLPPLAAAAVLAAWLVSFVGVPSALPPGPDMAWYTWRAELLTAYPPGMLVGFDGPLGVFGGGYRVATPLLAGLLGEVAGMDRYTVSVVLVAGRQALVAMVMGSLAYRFWPDPLLFAITSLFAAGLLFARPFLGVVDNMMALLFVSGALYFVGRRDASAVGGVFLLVLLAFFAHPPVAGLFVGTLVAAAALRALLDRRVTGARREDGPVAGAAIGAGAAALLLWWIGLWGPGRTFADAFHVAPVTAELFQRAVPGQLLALGPERLVALGLVGVALVVAARRPMAEHPFPRVLLTWLLPLLGLLGGFVGLRYPYKRAVTGTLAPVVLAGIGTWALSRFLLRLGALKRALLPMGALGIAVFVAVLVPTWRLGLAQYDDLPPWMTPERRSALAAASAYLERRPSDVVFLASASARMSPNRIWGEIWRGDWSLVRAGLPAEQIPRTHLFLGSAEDFLEGRPTRTGNPTLDLVSAGSLDDIRRNLRGRRPLVFLIRDMNLHLGNAAYLVPPRAAVIGSDLSLLLGPGLAEPDAGAVRAARVAGLAASGELASSPRLLDDPLHLARVALGLVFLLIVPGALARGWFRIRGPAEALAMVPLLSIGMNVAAGLVLLGVLRRPLTPAMGWATVGLATAAGVVTLWRRRFVRARIANIGNDGTSSRVAAGPGGG